MTTVPPTAEAVTQFWSFARDHVGWATMEPMYGLQQATLLEPAWMHLSGDEDEATSLLKQLTETGTLQVTTPFQRVPNQDELPARGDLVVVVDANGRPTALAGTLAVEVVPGAQGTNEATLVTETLRCLYPNSGPGAGS